jgi:hypothetical protein
VTCAGVPNFWLAVGDVIETALGVANTEAAAKSPRVATTIPRVVRFAKRVMESDAQVSFRDRGPTASPSTASGI